MAHWLRWAVTGLVENLDLLPLAMSSTDGVAVEGAGRDDWPYDLILPLSLCDNRTIRLRIISFDSRLPNYPRILKNAPYAG